MLFTFVFLFQLVAINSEAQNAKVNIKKNVLPLSELITEIEKQTNYLFVYSDSEINVRQSVEVNARDRSVSEVLADALENSSLTYEFANNYISLRKLNAGEAPKIAQQDNRPIRIEGTVLDPNGDPIIGANILEKGTTNGVITDLDGKYHLNVTENSTITVSYIGYSPFQYIASQSPSVTITLQEDKQALGEVVVTALGIKREEKALGYAVQKVGGNKLATVKTVDMATTLTGQIAGLNVMNSTEFNEAPSLTLRGETPLLVIDGVPYGNISLRDVTSDDIESIDVLKGATASALYGARGGNGAIMITTKSAGEEGLRVSVNSNTMFNAGYLKLPEVQTAYSSGAGGHYKVGDYVWGDKMDIGRTAVQYNPYTYEWEEAPLVSKGKNNLKNFQELSFITNNNVSVSQKGKYGSIRTSLTHVYNKGQFPNNKLNKFTYTVSGEMKYKDFTFDGGLTYNKRFYPNNFGTGYGGGGLLYNLVIWTGTEIDIRDYKNYWAKEHEQQNWMDNTWYDNPYMISNEIIASSHYDVTNAYFNAGYDIKPWLKVALRSGLDSYAEKKEWRNPQNVTGGWNRSGYYAFERNGGYSINNDAMIIADKTVGDFSLNGLAGGTIYFWESDKILSETQNGITIPGFYSLNASVDPVKTTKEYKRKQVNSVYGKASVGWRSTIFLDVTARNDWSSTLDKDTRSYFYPSFAGSVVLSEFIPLPKAFDFWKIRGSWTQTKQDLDVYDTNAFYSIATNVWDGMNTALYPTTIRGTVIKPSATRSWEIGTAFNFFQNRLHLDATYYNKLYYNMTEEAYVSPASGFEKTLINIDEEHLRQGVEITISGDIIRTKDFTWNSMINWSRDRRTYNKVDDVYSPQKPWVKKGERIDWLTGIYDYERDPDGNIVHNNGIPVISKYESNVGNSDPDWIWGWSNSLRYKDFTLSFTFDGRVGGKAFSTTDQAMWNSGAHIDSDNQWRYDEVVNGEITYVGQGVKVVSGSVDYDAYGNILRDDREFAANDQAVSYEAYILQTNPWIGNQRTQNIFDQTFFKLRNLAITYNCPASVCEKLRMKGASIGFVGQNLLIWTKEFRFADPDKAKENLNSPSIRYMGVNIKFDF